MEPGEEHVESFIKNFVQPERARRYLTLLHGNSKQRRKVSIAFNEDTWGLINERCEPLQDYMKSHRDPGEAADHIYNRLKSYGAPERCVLWTDDIEPPTGFDLCLQPGMALRDATDYVANMQMDERRAFTPVVISCIPGRLAFYKGEYFDDCWICKSP